MAQIDFGYVCTVSLTLELWPWVKAWPTLKSWTTIMWNIIQIQHGSEELWPRHGFCVQVHCDLGLGDMTLSQGHDTPFGHGQQLWEILSRSNVAVKSYDPVCTLTLTLEVWPWVKVMTHPWVMDKNCVKYYPDPTWQWGVMARTRNLGMCALARTQIWGMCALWPWPWRYDLGSRSWHILGSWTIIVWNIIQIGQGVKKLWPGHDVNRRTDRQTNRQTDGQGDSYIPPKLCLWGV